VKVAVILGGLSSERDVSINTGQAVVEACKQNNYDVQTVMIDKNYKKFLSLFKKVDIVFNALHGAMGEDGTIQKWLEKNNIRFTGSDSVSSALCMNKKKCKKILKSNNYLTPEWIELDETSTVSNSFLPCIVKPNAQGSTFGLTYVERSEDLNQAILNSQKFDKNTLIEEYILGREITVGIVEKNALPIIEIFPKNKIYDYTCKYIKGMTKYRCPADISNNLREEITKDSIKIFKLLGCKGYGRIDYIIDKNNDHYFLELNTLPGMTSTSLLPIAAKASGISFNYLVKKIIELGLIT
jgi:D-alanine-D-alanine ligase